MSADVILIDDEPHLLESGKQSLELAGLAVECHGAADGALMNITASSPCIIVSDVRMPGHSGLELMARALAIDPQIPVILITGHGDIPMAVQAIRDGAYDFIEKPFAPGSLVNSVAFSFLGNAASFMPSSAMNRAGMFRMGFIEQKVTRPVK